jgi:hypothetical protein
MVSEFIYPIISQKDAKINFIKKANIIHNNTYDYSLVKYKNATSNVIIRCPLHGVFKQTPSNHVSGGCGCSRCISKTSNISNIWLDQISEQDHIDIVREYQIPDTPYRADGYCIETNTIYEFYGDYWHGNPERYTADTLNTVKQKTAGVLYKNTMVRESHIKRLGFNMITIWEDKFLATRKNCSSSC